MRQSTKQSLREAVEQRQAVADMLSEMALAMESKAQELPEGEGLAVSAMSECVAILRHASARRLDPKIPMEDLLRSL